MSVKSSNGDRHGNGTPKYNDSIGLNRTNKRATRAARIIGHLHDDAI